jgi:hypothetical protein
MKEVNVYICGLEGCGKQKPSDKDGIDVFNEIAEHENISPEGLSEIVARVNNTRVTVHSCAGCARGCKRSIGLMPGILVSDENASRKNIPLGSAEDILKAAVEFVGDEEPVDTKG